jgi:hypothetical protein|tara:strand:- start:836 stop:1024 length:189 start_codon:yes stop_codon:yes gene_type:complete
MRLTKAEQQKIEAIDKWDEGEYTSYSVYLNKGWIFNGEDGSAFCEDTIAEVKETLKRVTKAA